MKTRKKLALIHATYNSVEPMTLGVRTYAPDMDVRFYVDSFLLQKVKEEGGISDAAKGRMLRMIAQACEDGADGIILCCTIFSAYQETFDRLFLVPIISPDGAMLDAVSRAGGRTAILCTFEGTVETTREVYFGYCRRNQMPETVDMYTAPEAFAAIQEGDYETGNRLLREKVMELDQDYDNIVLAQISMSGAAKGLTTQHARVYTSPQSAIEKIRCLIGENGEKNTQ